MAARVDQLTISTGKLTLGGWSTIRVTRGAERLPSDFDIIATDRFSAEPGGVDISPGDVCEIRLGGDLVLTGYVDRIAASISASDHTVRIRGRSKCQDLVDCAAIASGMTIQSATTLELAKTLAAKFGITVRALSGEGPQLQAFGIALSETPYEIIERCARWSELLVYDDPTGNLVLARAGATSMGSGVAQGVNVQAALAEFGMDQRFSEVLAVIQSVDALQQIRGDASDISPGNLIWRELDKTVPRYRPHIIMAEQGLMGLGVAEKRAKWEVARRYGRSQAVRVTVDSWRDAAGKLWQPNAVLPVELPALKISAKDWVIGEVSFSNSMEAGTTADLVVMPKAAFEPAPTLLYPFDWQVAQSVRTQTFTDKPAAAP